MMRSLVIISFFVIPSLAFAQKNNNPFAGENTNARSGNVYNSPQGQGENNGKKLEDQKPLPTTASPTAVEAARGPGADGLPIDDYIPLFILVALGIIVYQKRLVKNTQA